jgi:DNA-binding transcriptional MocR family regulator
MVRPPTLIDGLEFDESRAALKPRVHRGVVQGLAVRILRGEFQPGDSLPNETQLCADLSVSRTSLREAIRVLSAKGLVETKPRTGTRVRAREAWNRLDPEILELARPRFRPQPDRGPPDHRAVRGRAGRRARDRPRHRRDRGRPHRHDGGAAA